MHHGLAPGQVNREGKLNVGIFPTFVLPLPTQAFRTIKADAPFYNEKGEAAHGTADGLRPFRLLLGCFRRKRDGFWVELVLLFELCAQYWRDFLEFMP